MLIFELSLCPEFLAPSHTVLEEFIFLNLQNAVKKCIYASYHSIYLALNLNSISIALGLGQVCQEMSHIQKQKINRVAWLRLI